MPTSHSQCLIASSMELGDIGAVRRIQGLFHIVGARGFEPRTSSMSRNSRHAIYQHKRSLTCGVVFVVVHHVLVVALRFAGFPRDGSAPGGVQDIVAGPAWGGQTQDAHAVRHGMLAQDLTGLQVVTNRPATTSPAVTPSSSARCSIASRSSGSKRTGSGCAAAEPTRGRPGRRRSLVGRIEASLGLGCHAFNHLRGKVDAAS
ncbi:MAG: hypothetical protein JWM17_2373 [Actinobacteria bacterium]|nr:hypothetical protein [Actinomycetota bacterium]